MVSLELQRNKKEFMPACYNARKIISRKQEDNLQWVVRCCPQAVRPILSNWNKYIVALASSLKENSSLDVNFQI
ncbi:hypothetical protein PM082_019856 [Marasmius tenuissimus]|nr:hypothetical protein PM082_019856 [Marasmius tenuissimus]